MGIVGNFGSGAFLDLTDAAGIERHTAEEALAMEKYLVLPITIDAIAISLVLSTDSTWKKRTVDKK